MNRKTRRSKLIFPLLVLLALVLILPSGQILADVARSPILITVNTTADGVNGDCSPGSNSTCSLRQAIQTANAAGQATITLANATYDLTISGANDESAARGDLDITGELTINGAAPSIINAAGLGDRVFHVHSGASLTLHGVTIRNGQSGNNGGGILNDGTLTIIESTIANNTAVGDGGGIFNQGAMTIERSTISGNVITHDDGGGIFNQVDATLAMTNTTISGNSAADDGGGIFQNGSQSSTIPLTLNNVTITDNQAGNNGGGLKSANGPVTYHNSIIAGNRSGRNNSADCHGLSKGSNTSLGYNLLGEGCPFTPNDPNPKDLPTDLSTILEPLVRVDPGDPTATHALKPYDPNDPNPAIDAGDPDLDPNVPPCPATDQRNTPRPFDGDAMGDAICDIGAYEAGDPPQTGSPFIVNTNGDLDDGTCGLIHCSLPEAIEAANLSPNPDDIPEEIHFELQPDSNPDPNLIQLHSPLPAITDPVTIDGTTQAGGWVDLDGSQAGATAGLTVEAPNTTIHGLLIHSFNGNGVIVASAATGVTLLGNLIYDNSGLAIDLDDDGPTANDNTDQDGRQNHPVLIQAVPFPGGDDNQISPTTGLTITGHLNSTPNSSFALAFFASDTCGAFERGQGQIPLVPREPLATEIVQTDERGDVYFTKTFTMPLRTEPYFVAATATSNDDGTSEFSPCIVTGPDNDSWPRALLITPNSGIPYNQYLDMPGQSRWYKFKVIPNSKVTVILTGLPANYDLTLYKDIKAAYDTLEEQAKQQDLDLTHLSAEYAADAFSPSAFSPSAFSPSAFSPSAFSPSAFSPSAFSPSAFSPSAFSPSAFSPSAFSPSAFSPSAFSPSAFSPSAFSPSAFSPSAFSPSAFSPSAFSSAQTISLIGVSAFEGTAGEGIQLNTWNNDGDFYIRVRGREGTYSLAAPFQLQTWLLSAGCEMVSPIEIDSNDNLLTGVGGSYDTLILVDENRMPGVSLASDEAKLRTRLQKLADAATVNGVIIDVSQDDRVARANGQADDYPDCPYAKNLVASEIKRIIDSYWATNPDLKHLVLVGNDDVIPFFRYPDEALLGPEQGFAPPVKDSTHSQSSLRLNYVLGQDQYGAQETVSYKGNILPIPALAVGRLVETPADIVAYLNVFLDDPDGLVLNPTSSLVTGYDFLEDAALAVQTELEAGLGPDGSATSLITLNDVSPADRRPDDPATPLLETPWTADDLRGALLGSRHDLIFLAGHFNASSALAADFETSLFASEVVAPDVDLKKALIFSAGCHSGYNIVDQDDVPELTIEPDWAQALAQKGATLVAGTGYQYGDTEFIEYSERLYLEFSRRLREGSGPVSIGQALVQAKRDYLIQTPQLRGIHEKAFLEATLFGLPMAAVDMPGERLPLPDAPTVVPTTAFTTNPGLSLGLNYADLPVTPNLTTQMIDLTDVTDVDNPTIQTATYLSGTNGIVTNPAEPTLPLEIRDVSAATSGLVLRGVGFRGGNYTDLPGILPLTGAATTEIRGVHTPFLTDVFYPVKPWHVNYFDALGGGSTRLMLTPAQFKSSTSNLSPLGTMRIFDDIHLRLYYSDYPQDDKDDPLPALSAAPTIVSVAGEPDGSSANFKIHVVGNPAAGIQAVWIVYTIDKNDPDSPCFNENDPTGAWLPVDLAQQDPNDSTLWEGTLALETGIVPECVRYIVQAVNGVGLTSLATNLGVYYTPGLTPLNPAPTNLTLDVPVVSGRYGEQATFSAILTDQNNQGLADQPISFSLGPQTSLAVTDGQGQATVTMPLLGSPDDYQVYAAYPGSVSYQAAFDSGSFTIEKQNTCLVFAGDDSDPDPCPQLPSPYELGEKRAGDQKLATVILTENIAGTPPANQRRLGEKTVIFVLTDNQGNFYNQAVITDYVGRASLGPVPLPSGKYELTVFFNGTVTLGDGQTLTLFDDRYTATKLSGSLTLSNEPPNAVDDGVTTAEDTPLTITVLDNDSDPEGDQLTITAITNPASGTAVISAGSSIVYTPALNFNGMDNFIYTISDNQGGSDTATVTITVTAVNDPPQLDPIVDLVVDEGANLDITVSATDIEGDPITLTASGLPDFAGFTDNGAGSGLLTLTPTFDDAGIYPNAILSASDGNLTDTVSFTITVKNVNRAPIVADQAAATDEDTAVPITLTANDPDGDVLSYTVTLPANGSLDGTAPDLIYTPTPDYNGLDSFSFEACDPGGLCDTAIVSITINAVNDTPQAMDDTYSTDEDTQLTVPAPGVLENDSDVEGDPLAASLLSAPDYGTLSLNLDGSFIYTPTADFNGSDSFTYQACDSAGACAKATVAITVNPVNDPPIAVDDSYSTNEDTLLTIPAPDAPGVLSNDTDVDGDSLSAVLDSGPAHGDLILKLDGSFVYTPTTDFSGEDSFTYRAADGSVQSDPATVTITVNRVNQPPVCDGVGLDQYTIWPPDKELHQIKLSGAFDPDGDSVTVTITSIFQDEPVSGGKEGDFDGRILISGAGEEATFEIRADRNGNGDGRVYHISFEVSDGQNNICSGEDLVGIVSHDNSDLEAIDQGPLYDSTVTPQ